MELTKNFKSLGKNDAAIAGGKGASLGEMTQAGILVPPGFVVLSTTFDEFIKEVDLVQEIDAVLDEVNHKDINSVEVASEKIQALIKNAMIPESIAKEIKKQFKKLDTEFVAVRSSATAEDGTENAWAGQLDSYLNTKEENLLEKVQHCWASLFTPRAIFYRFEKGLHKTKISVAVVVQKMVNSEVSGIAFSVHPVTEDKNQMIIEAGYGLGEAVVSGQITPNSYVIEKEPRRIIDVNVFRQTRGLFRVKSGGNEWMDISEPKASSQALTEKHILELVDLILKIENHYGFPCDIEWAFEKGKFYITQSRPITTIIKNKNSERVVMVSHQSDLLTQDLILSGVQKYCKFSDFGLSFDFPLIKYDHSSGDISYPVWQVDILKNLDFSQNEVKKLVSFLSKELSEYKVFIKKFEKNIKTSKNKERKIKEYFDYSEKASATIPYFAFEMALYKNLERDGVKPQDIHSSITDTTRASLELASLAKKNEKEINLLRTNKGKIISKKLKKELNSFCARFGYLGMIYFKGNSWTTSEAYRMLLSAHSNERKNENKKHLSKFAEYASDLLRLRTQKWEIMCYGCYLFKKYIQEFFKDEIVYDDLLNLRIDEVINLVYGIYPLSGYPNRENFEIEIKEDGVFLNTKHKKLENLKENTERVKGIKEIKGITAQKGIVQGKVKIILSPKDGYKLEEGDILVTKMSTPDFLPIMKKASAFVTDIGGITSHAAIVSREMKKPCIIGTVNATKFLKDGDVVEVNADMGIVKILS